MKTALTPPMNSENILQTYFRIVEEESIEQGRLRKAQRLILSRLWTYLTSEQKTGPMMQKTCFPISKGLDNKNLDTFHKIGSNINNNYKKHNSNHNNIIQKRNTPKSYVDALRTNNRQQKQQEEQHQQKTGKRWMNQLNMTPTDWPAAPAEIPETQDNPNESTTTKTPKSTLPTQTPLTSPF
ncbi:hypothetical protein CHS0354_039432 [Potamilus streckersoni]|uniref:Uncharacterized protein n=1 Tax=Potamilus streckersoni TaxID=2493646 RepID=A0AAE0S1Q6_9BIVA|nr:hypothetical protein CHS0354_039432 [Potamilus streckersoni]